MRYRNYGLPVAELVSEGNIGLMQAVKKYNPDLGHRLSTYAMWWIKASIQEYVLRSWSLVKIGTTSAQKKLFFSLGKIKHRITSMHARAVTYEDYGDIADELGIKKQEVLDMNQRLAGQDLSLNVSVNSNGEGGSEMIDMLQESKPSQEIVLIQRQDMHNKRKLKIYALSQLNPREADIIQKRRLSENPSTLDDLSIEYNISKERVRQIENRAFEKIQQYILSKFQE
jgi:RNA polymerase sigma-32 factor